MSVMEMSHRGSEFGSIAESAEAKLRELMAVPADYRVLFLQGGAMGQFAAVPMNLIGPEGAADYVITGHWAKRAHGEAARLATGVRVAAASPGPPHTSIPPHDTWDLRSVAGYVHITLNETIDGLAYFEPPETGDIPLVADVSSVILGQPIDVTKFGVLYAGAQKNIGPAGLTVVIVRDDLIGRARPGTPAVWDWAEMAKSGSRLNTPPTFGWYLAGLVFDWLADQGGVASIAEVNRRKAARLYAVIDASDFYANPVQADCRSIMNVPFTLARADLDGEFLAGAKAVGLLNLEGHRAVGGMRASIYNAMPESGVDALIDYMKEFEAAHG
jgi:phosphoserine aminotransferase